MATKELKRYDCVCDKCGHQWTTRLEGLPKNCPNCLARIQVWNRSEYGDFVDSRVGKSGSSS